MKRYLYLSVTPEALISSQLPPDEFGNYQAVGTKKRTRGQSIFFEIDPDLAGSYVPKDYIEKRCVPHADGTPKRSVYISIYRVLENIPLKAFKSLYLTTDDGRTLELTPGTFTIDPHKSMHLYQELNPVTPRVASVLDPIEFGTRVTDTSHHVSVPKLVFAELELGALASDPMEGEANNLPYANVTHLRDCLMQLQAGSEKLTKTVIRTFKGDLLYRTVKNGFFVAAGKEILFYPMPSQTELEDKHFAWWRSALTIGF